MPTKIYSYGCRIDRAETKSIADKQFHLSTVYYNRLIEIERKRMENYAELQKKFSLDVQTSTDLIKNLDTQLADALAALQTSKIKLRSKRGGDAERQTVAELRDRIKQERMQLSAAKTTLKESAEFKAAAEQQSEEYDVACKAAYAEFTELFWGTKNQIREDVLNATKKTKFGPPRFKSFRYRDGRLTCQIQGGLTAAEVNACTDQRVQIHRVEAPVRDAEHMYRHNVTPGTLHPKWRIVKLRIGSVEKARPLWLDCFTFLHRPLPDNGKIVSVALVRRQGYYKPQKELTSDGRKTYRPHDDYFIQFTVTTPAETSPELGPDNYVAVDLGWRIMHDRGIRVAFWRSSGGLTGELRLPESLWQRATKCEELQSIMDRNFNDMRGTLVEWLKLHTHPDWLKEKCETLSQWKSRYKMLSLISQWTKFDGDDAIYEALSTWRDKDQHLDAWRVCNYSKLDRIRKDMYRNFTSKLRKAYGTLVIEDFDIAEMRKKPLPEAQTDAFDPNLYRNVAAIGCLRACLIEGFGKYRVFKAPTAGTTLHCNNCGAAQEWDRSKIFHTCTQCSKKWDQDDNAATNMNNLFEKEKAEFVKWRTQEIKNIGTQAPETRWSKRKAKKIDGAPANASGEGDTTTETQE